jgi:hypothetical protein
MQLRPSSVRGNLAASLPNLFSSREITLNFAPSLAATDFLLPSSITGIVLKLKPPSNLI